MDSNDATVLFRANKKRKVYRHRMNEDDNTVVAQAEDEAPVADILRLRKQRKSRVAGVEFRVDQSKQRGQDDESQAVEGSAYLEQGTEIKKFAPQTGTVGDVNKHMMAYIDSQMAKQQHEPTAVSRSHLDKQTETTSTDRDAHKQPATLGKLLEIDLGDEARARNIERTQQARRRLDGEAVEDEDEGRKKKPRLGRDGKPWRSRKRRTSDDIKRDRLVEDILRENRLDIYDAPPTTTAVPDEQAADDRIAEEFRREFLDAASTRQRKKAAASGSKRDEEPKGPKLGGSRSARAAMREMQMKAVKK